MKPSVHNNYSDGCVSNVIAAADAKVHTRLYLALHDTYSHCQVYRERR